MRKLLSILAVVTLVVGLAGVAQAYTINDEYWGADHHGYGDVIGAEADFGVDAMQVDIVDDIMTVKIETNFTPISIGGYDIDYGDLFISTNGWNPNDDEAYYASDNFNNDGEVWEYVFDVDAEKLYNISSAQDNILLSDEVLEPSGSGLYLRDGQEVLIDNEGLQESGTGSVEVGDGYYAMSFNVSDLELPPEYKLGFHWGMTCANDVIEGEFDPAIPEPSTVLLLGAGLLGIVGIVGRKRNKK